MSDQRQPHNTGADGNHLAKVTHDLTSDTTPQGSWLDGVRNSAYSASYQSSEFVHHCPVGTAFGVVAIGVAAYGAVRTGMFTRVLARAAEEEVLAGGTEAAVGTGKSMVHLTTAEGEIGIAKSLKIGSRWGVFALDSAKVPESAALRSIKSLVPRELVGEVQIGPRAASYFKPPAPLGPFSGWRNLTGVKSTPLGTIDLARDAFIPNEILSNGAFRPATASEVSKYKVHQWLLDYGVDTLAYGWAGLTVAAAEYGQKMPWQSPTKQWQWHPISPQDQHK